LANLTVFLKFCPDLLFQVSIDEFQGHNTENPNKKAPDKPVLFALCAVAGYESDERKINEKSAM